jgi:Fic family protein
LLDLPVLYLSKYIIEHRVAYYRLLRGVTESQTWEPWILYVLDAIESMAQDTRKKITDTRDLMREIQEACKKQLAKRVYSKDLIELIFRQPYTKGQFLVEAGIAERKTAAEYLKQLEKIGILRRRKVGKENLYLNVKLYELLSR